MRALCLLQLNREAVRFGEEQTHGRIAQDAGGFADRMIERRLAIAHERSPWKTTHDDLRPAVAASSGGVRTSPCGCRFAA